MSASLINVVLDLETLGLREDAAIIQIGAVIPDFDVHNLPPAFLGKSLEFEATVKYEECLHSVFTISNETMEWWEKQPTRTQVFSGQDDYPDVFDAFTKWVDSIGVPIALWGNGSDFDNRLLSYSMNALGFKPPWEFRNNRDLRTIQALSGFSKSELIRHPTQVEHTALGDARFEAEVLDLLVRTHRYKI